MGNGRYRFEFRIVWESFRGSAFPNFRIIQSLLKFFLGFFEIAGRSVALGLHPSLMLFDDPASVHFPFSLRLSNPILDEQKPSPRRFVFVRQWGETFGEGMPVTGNFRQSA